MSDDNSDSKSKSKSRKRYEIPKTATCNVCGDIAAEHLHYGGIACYSCRAFFRRTVNSNRPILECSNDLKCKIDKHTRKRCQFCRFEKCKAAGMKTSWVLTEDDKSKVSAKRPLSSEPSPDINIKTETDIDAPVADPSVAVKNRHPSSPTPFKSSNLSNQFFQGDNPHIYQGIPRPTPNHTSYPGPFGPGPVPAYNYNLSMNPIASGVSGMFPGNMGPGKHPNMNTMHVSLSTPADGLSLTIETGHSSLNPASMSGPASNNSNMESLTSPRQMTKQEEDTSPGGSVPGTWHGTLLEVPSNKKQKRHHQQSRTIFRCVSGEFERDCDSRSTMSSQISDYSPSTENLRTGFPNNNRQDFAFSPREEIENINSGESGSNGEEHIKAQVWKLQDIPFDNSFRGGIGHPQSQSVLNAFTLQETLFVEQLTSIDERVRFQVPMDVSHGRSLLECAITGAPISQMTIMHAYQTCIKRIVRFANSLQDFVELPPDDMQKLLVSNTVSIINIKISRWLSEDTSLFTQMGLLGTGEDLYKQAVDEGRVTEDLNLRVSYSDIFISPWCCDSSHEDRYEALIGEMHQLELDPTTVVLLSVMSLFYISESLQSQPLSSSSTIVSHKRKFSLLLQRYLVQSKGQERAAILYEKYQESLEKLHEMAEILINKRLI